MRAHLWHDCVAARGEARACDELLDHAAACPGARLRTAAFLLFCLLVDVAKQWLKTLMPDLPWLKTLMPDLPWLKTLMPDLPWLKTLMPDLRVLQAPAPCPSPPRLASPLTCPP